MENNYAPTLSPHMSDDIRQLMGAFIIARLEFTKTGKSGINKNQNYSYSKIEDIYEAVIPHLGAQDIAVWHFAYPYLHKDELLLLLETRLIHKPSGQWTSDKRFIQSEKPGNQAHSSANTYMRKCAVLSLCGIATEDDDSEAEQKFIEEHNITKKPEVITERINQQTFSSLTDLIRGVPEPAAVMSAILAHNEIEHLKELTIDKVERVTAYILKQKGR